MRPERERERRKERKGKEVRREAWEKERGRAEREIKQREGE